MKENYHFHRSCSSLKRVLYRRKFTLVMFHQVFEIFARNLSEVRQKVSENETYEILTSKQIFIATIITNQSQSAEILRVRRNILQLVTSTKGRKFLIDSENPIYVTIHTPRKTALLQNNTEQEV